MMKSENMWAESDKDSSFEMNVNCLKEGRRLLQAMAGEFLPPNVQGEERHVALAMIHLFGSVTLKMEGNSGPTQNQVDVKNQLEQSLTIMKNGNPMVQKHMKKAEWALSL